MKSRRCSAFWFRGCLVLMSVKHETYQMRDDVLTTVSYGPTHPPWSQPSVMSCRKWPGRHLCWYFMCNPFRKRDAMLDKFNTSTQSLGVNGQFTTNCLNFPCLLYHSPPLAKSGKEIMEMDRTTCWSALRTVPQVNRTCQEIMTLAKSWHGVGGWNFRGFIAE